MRLIQKIAGITSLSLSSCLTLAQTPWPTYVYQSYLKQCTNALVAQGADSVKAAKYCYCVTTGLSGEFGMEEYEHIRKIQPNADGTQREKRLYKVMDSCVSAIK